MTFGDIARNVDEERLWSAHMSLARHGVTPKGGVHRLALSPEEIAARKELIEVARVLDLEVSTDAIGNLFFRMVGKRDHLPAVMTGSHIDSQPAGGKFDGAFGVLAGFEAVRAMREASYQPTRPLVVVSWMNEEASRFAPGMMGSEAFAGLKPLESILAVIDNDGVNVREALAKVAAAFPELETRPLGFPVHSFVEAHIEQGPVLEKARKPVGIVTGMQGSRRFRLTVHGEEAHAGTQPLTKRRDALLAALDIIAGLKKAFRDPDDVVKFTVGRFDVKPNAPSVVPSEVFFSIDLRHPDWPTLKQLGDSVEGIAHQLVGPCTVTVDEIATSPSLNFPESLVRVLEETAGRLEIEHMRLYSAAGHDARQLHYHCPTAMLFVPCADGISHSEAESANASDLAAGTRVLAEALARLCEEEDLR